MTETKYEEQLEYKEMYIVMMREMERAINIMVAAQQRCEEMYINACAPNEGGDSK